MGPPTTAGLLYDVITSLPPEIQSTILEYFLLNLTRSQLKQFRFSSSTYPIASSLLFGTLHISASKKSFVRLEQVAKNENLARHVRRLVFHRGTWAGHSLTRSQLRPKDFEDYTIVRNRKRNEAPKVQARSNQRIRPLRVGSTNSTEVLNISMEQQYENFYEELLAEKLFEREIYIVPFISGLIPLLPNLCAVSVPEDTKKNTQEDESEYFERTVGLQQQTWTKNYFSPPEVIQAVVQPLSGLSFGRKASKVAIFGTTRLKELRLEGVNLSDFAEIFLNQRIYQPHSQEAAFQACFGRLEVFSFSPADVVDNEWEYRHSQFEKNWKLFIGTFSETLRELRLDMSRSFHNTGFSVFHTSMIELIVKGFLNHSNKFEQLNVLELTNVQMGEDNFVAFLEKIWRSLEVMMLHGWQIPVIKEGGSNPHSNPQGSILSGFKKIGKLHSKMRQQHNITSRLRHVSLVGEFSNRYDYLGWLATTENALQTDSNNVAESQTSSNDSYAMHNRYEDVKVTSVDENTISTQNPVSCNRSSQTSIRRLFELYMLGRLPDLEFPVHQRSLDLIAFADWSSVHNDLLIHSEASTCQSVGDDVERQRVDDIDLRRIVLSEGQEDPRLMRQDRSWRWLEFRVD